MEWISWRCGDLGCKKELIIELSRLEPDPTSLTTPAPLVNNQIVSDQGPGSRVIRPRDMRSRGLKARDLREEVKYYFADFVRKGGGGGVPPKSVTAFSPKILSVKGEWGIPPKSVTSFLPKNRCFLGKKHHV